MWWSSHPDVSTNDTRELWGPCWCVRYSCFHWGRHLSNSPLQLYLRIMKPPLQSAWWSRSFQPVLQGNKSHTMQECGCVCQQSAFSAWELSAKISRGIAKLNFESASRLFVRDSSFHMDVMFHCVSCIIIYTEFHFNFLILSFPVVGIFFLSFSGQVIHMLIEICLLFEA